MHAALKKVTKPSADVDPREIHKTNELTLNPNVQRQTLPHKPPSGHNSPTHQLILSNSGLIPVLTPIVRHVESSRT